MHHIRRTILFVRGRLGEVTYDENHPDDLAPDNLPFLLRLNGRNIGVARLDLKGDNAVMRLVAIDAGEQARGHGRVLNALIEDEAKGRGLKTLLVNAAPTAVGFYEKTGWERFTWNASELAGIASDCIQMRKRLD
ncbi:hypothetical protein ATN84_25425 [Paramesorhizobium deserti]|uniref:N-acetyltransferase domain-containing protein n=2 Tax=Paramesorhizobium deserti TaxID=1494590 RepID=A0A135HVG8_9HYPH|nr:hypothetical protein ATN84_25425 [Paramesorhizobium deserti]